jgi:ATP-binding cassette subfamily F protein 3
MLLLDEPTNHLDLDSKDVLLEALEDFGGTLIFVSHDRYFVDRLANKIVVVGDGAIEVYPGTYEQFLWSRHERSRPGPADAKPVAPSTPRPPASTPDRTRSRNTDTRDTTREADARPAIDAAKPTYEDKKRADAEQRRRRREAQERTRRIAELEALIAQRERTIKDLEANMAAPGFYDDRSAAESAIARHQALMWEVGDLMQQWEHLQAADVAD